MTMRAWREYIDSRRAGSRRAVEHAKVQTDDQTQNGETGCAARSRTNRIELALAGSNTHSVVGQGEGYDRATGRRTVLAAAAGDHDVLPAVDGVCGRRRVARER